MTATTLPLSATIRLADADATARFATWMAPRLSAGDCLLLQGPIGAGKTHFARSLIQHLLAKQGLAEDVPSPTFTLVQTYQAGGLEIWHCDLYRLTHASEALELGLDEALDQALCLIEWPERLGRFAPTTALSLTFAPDKADDSRSLTAQATAARWQPLLAAMQRWVDGG